MYVRRAYDLYGTPPAYVRGKMTKKNVSRAVINDSLIMEEKKQVLSTDVMHWEGTKYLITVCEPLQLVLQTPIDSEGKTQLGLALQGHLSILRERGFIPTVVYADPQSAFRSLTGSFPGVVIDITGAGDHVPKVDAKIRRIKELCRSVKESLPWKIPKNMQKDLVAYAVGRINIRRTTAINLNICPKVLFTGMKINFKKELELAFGDYAEVYDGTDNTSTSRSIPCIALYPSNNMNGSWEFMNLRTKQRVRRSHWVKMKTTNLIVDVMNSFDDKELPVVQEVEQPPIVQPEVTAEPIVEQASNEEVEVEAPVVEEPAENIEVPDLVDADDNDSASEDESEDEEEIVEEPIAARTRQRTGETIRKPSKYLFATKMDKRTEKDPKRLASIKRAEVSEIKLLYHEELDALEPVTEEELGDNKAHGSHLFTVEKFLANGEHDKCNTRLVLHGNEQDPLLFPNKSSPTVAIHSILSCLTVAAYNGVQEAVKIDVKGAFIQTPMEGPPVYMRCDKNLTRLIVEVYPQFKKYVSKDGYLYNRLKKTLYGCIQASSLWFKKLVKFLTTQGYEQSPTDPCVMPHVVNGQIFLLLIYVDDVLILADCDELSV